MDNKEVLDVSKQFLDINISDFNKQDIEKLQRVIQYHSDLYYNKQNPIISDYEYDILFSKLQQLESDIDSSFIQTSLVWAELWESTFEKVKHSRPMISLDNTYNNEDLHDFDERIHKLSGEQWEIEYTLEFKFDWLWVELIYKEGKLTQAITRWNGIQWEDVTINAMQIDNIPKVISYKKHLEVRGEVVMPISVFYNLNEQAKKDGGKIFSNPRNAASWSMRMKDASVTKNRKLKFFAYDLANFNEFVDEENISHYHDVILDLEKLWFEISSYFLKLNGITWVIDSIENFWDIKKNIDFEIDGLVLKVNDIVLWNNIWSTEHHPRYAIAYKFPAEILTTKIIWVEHSVWRTGTITPVANLDPIFIWWVMVKRATLHNYEEVENLDVRIWDDVFIKRAGEVIPKIISVVQKEWRDTLEKITPPEFCPSCETKVKKDEDKVRYYCPNTIDCPASHHEKLTFAVGKQWFNIDGLWEKQIESFLREWIIYNLVDIFKISEKQNEILELEWFKDKSVSNLIHWIEEAKNVDIAILLTALWIPWVWKKTAKTLSKMFTSKNDLLHFLWNFEELEELEDIWPEIAKNVLDYFSNYAHKRILSELVEILNIHYYEEKVISSNSIFNNKKVCITGSFEKNSKKISRDDLVKQLEEVWWNFVSSVSKNTDYLLAWEKAWSKKSKAEKFEVPIIDLEYFENNL